MSALLQTTPSSSHNKATESLRWVGLVGFDAKIALLRAVTDALISSTAIWLARTV